MQRINWDRWAPISGVLTVAFLVATFFLPAKSPPNVNDSGAKIAAFATDHRTALLVSAYLTGVAAFFLLWFVGSLVTRIRDGGERRISVVALGGGLGVAVVAFGAVAIQLAIAYSVAEQGDNGVTRGLFTVMWLAPFGFPIAALSGAVAVASLRSQFLPRWYGMASGVAAVWFLVAQAALAKHGFMSPTGAASWIAFLAFLVWLLVTSVLMLMPARERAPRTVAAPTA